MAAAETKAAAPAISLGSQMEQMPHTFGADQASKTPLVTKDELIEGSKMSLSAQDSAAKDRAVQETLNRLKGIKNPEPVAPPQLPQYSLQPSFYASQPTSTSSLLGSLASPATTPAISVSTAPTQVQSTPTPFLSATESTPAPFVMSQPAPPSVNEKSQAVSRTLELIRSK